MLTGRVAFPGDTVSDHIAAILEREPDWHALPASTPMPIRRLLRRCLAKEPRRRLSDISVARREIDDAITADPDAESPVSAVNEGASRARLQRVLPSAALAILAALAGVLVTFVVTRPASTPPPTPVTRFAIALPATRALAFSVNDRDLALSSDGTRLVYTAGTEAQLMIRAFDRLNAVPLVGITNARAPFLSPDGRWIGLFDRLDEGLSNSPTARAWQSAHMRRITPSGHGISRSAR